MSQFEEPEFKGAIEGYVVNHLRANFWRVESSMQWQDVMQSAAVVFLRVRQKYSAIPMGPHFMSLFKMAWANEFTDLANADTKLRQLVPFKASRQAEGEGAEMDPVSALVGELECDGYLAVKIEQAPSEVKAVLNLFLNAPAELLDMALRGWHGRNKKMRYGGSERINKLLGLPADADVLKQVEEYFSE